MLHMVACPGTCYEDRSDRLACQPTPCQQEVIISRVVVFVKQHIPARGDRDTSPLVPTEMEE